jgi:hypothetical protein
MARARFYSIRGAAHDGAKSVAVPFESEEAGRALRDKIGLLN